MARYIAKNLVAAHVAKKILVQLSYAIGIADPISISINTYGTSPYSDDKILEVVREIFDCRPGMIVEAFSLKSPSFKYHEICNYGHFGKPYPELPWEQLDKVDAIKKALQN